MEKVSCLSYLSFKNLLHSPPQRLRTNYSKTISAENTRKRKNRDKDIDYGFSKSNVPRVIESRRNVSGKKYK